MPGTKLTLAAEALRIPCLMAATWLPGAGSALAQGNDLDSMAGFAEVESYFAMQAYDADWAPVAELELKRQLAAGPAPRVPIDDAVVDCRSTSCRVRLAYVKDPSLNRARVDQLLRLRPSLRASLDFDLAYWSVVEPVSPDKPFSVVLYFIGAREVIPGTVAPNRSPVEV